MIKLNGIIVEHGIFIDYIFSFHKKRKSHEIWMNERSMYIYVLAKRREKLSDIGHIQIALCFRVEKMVCHFCPIIGAV
jgi:hypothetical protein